MQKEIEEVVKDTAAVGLSAAVLGLEMGTELEVVTRGPRARSRNASKQLRDAVRDGSARNGRTRRKGHQSPRLPIVGTGRLPRRQGQGVLFPGRVGIAG